MILNILKQVNNNVYEIGYLLRTATGIDVQVSYALFPWITTMLKELMKNE